MKSAPDSVDDLLILARRGDLPPADERRLRDALAAAPENRALFEAGQAFDDGASVLAGDDERIERIANAVLARTARRPGRRWMIRLGVAAALIVGAAIGAIELTRKDDVTVPPPPVPSVPTVVVAPSDEPAPPITEDLAPPVPSSSASPPPPVAHHASARRVEVDAGAPPSAGDLFVSANRARVRGDAAEAIRLSQTLESQYPNSQEAVTTHLSLGMLYLQANQPADALREFRVYRIVGTRATMAEAIWGEGQALNRLGRPTEERAVLEELLSAYPQSAYTAAAKKRLADMP